MAREESAQDFSDVTLVFEESAQEFFDVPLAYEKSPLEFFDVTLAWEDDRFGVHHPNRRCKFSFIVSY